MKLWLLQPVSGPMPRPFQTYDTAHGFVVRAKNEQAARAIAAENCGDESATAWLDASFSDCTQLLATGKPEMILRDFHAG